MENKNSFWYNLILILTFVILVGIYLGEVYFKDKASQETSAHISGGSVSSPAYQLAVYEPATEEDYQRLEQIIPENEIFQKLPDDAKLSLSFYNFDNGEREWEKSYIATQGSLVEGSPDDVDIKLIMHSKYLSKLNENNFCSVVQDARAHGDFGAEPVLSTAGLLWKYKSLMSYKSCLGL